jgi:hypothetical protein
MATSTSRYLIFALITCCCFARFSAGQIMNDNNSSTYANDNENLQNYDDETASYPISWAVVNFTVGVVELVTSLIGILFIVIVYSSKKTRNTSFNLYLIFLLIPDVLINAAYGIVQVSLAFNDGIYKSGYCTMGLLSYFFYFFCNFPLNAVVAYEIHTLLIRSSKRMRTQPPSLRKVYTQILVVYLFACLMTVWFTLGLFGVPWSPMYIVNEDTYATTLGSTILTTPVCYVIFWSVILVPTIYVVYVRSSIWYRNLLPDASDRMKSITYYFMRIVLLFFGFYIPNLILGSLNYIDSRYVWFWTFVGIHILVPIQCLVTLRLAMTKEDIRDVITGTWGRTSQRRSSIVLCAANITAVFTKDDKNDSKNNDRDDDDDRHIPSGECDPVQYKEDMEIDEGNQRDERPLKI